ncbi:galactose-1-phosphate uridylyltransferase, partial [bacterium]|nr:galactose-1-phosphate uridylyltransferase [bacterium]
IFCDVVRQELEQKERIVAEDGNFLAFTPFASRRPFEVWMLPEKHETFFEQNSNQGALASMLITVMGKIRQMLKNPDYIITLHSGPNINVSRRRGYWKTLKSDFHWHLEVVPLLRSYTSFELGSGFPINSVPPEIAARVLREESF